MGIIIWLINTSISLLILLVIVHVILGYVLRPYHPVRSFIGKIVEPLLAPIRAKIRPINGLDFSPVILIILLQILGMIINAVLRSL